MRLWLRKEKKGKDVSFKCVHNLKEILCVVLGNERQRSESGSVVTELYKWKQMCFFEL